MRIRIIFLLIMIISSPSYNAQNYSDRFHFISDAYCPFVCDGAQRYGFLAEYVQLLFALRAEIFSTKAKIMIKKPDKVKNEIFLNMADIIIDYDERNAKTHTYSERPVLESKMCFYGRKSDPWKFIKEGSLKGKSIIGIERKWIKSFPIIFRFFEDEINKSQLIEQNGNLEVAAHKTVGGEFDLFFSSKILFQRIKKNVKNTYLLENKGCLKKKIAFKIGFLKKHPRHEKIMTLINTFIKEFPKASDGLYQKLYSFYF